MFIHVFQEPSKDEKIEFPSQSRFFTPVPFPEIKTWKNVEAKVKISSCEKEDNGINLTIQTDIPQPFVWLETTILNGQWDENNILLKNEKTSVFWRSTENIQCDQFVKTIEIYHPSMVSFYYGSTFSKTQAEIKFSAIFNRVECSRRWLIRLK